MEKKKKHFSEADMDTDDLDEVIFDETDEDNDAAIRAFQKAERKEREDYRTKWLAEEQKKLDDLAAEGVKKRAAEQKARAKWQADLDKKRADIKAAKAAEIAKRKAQREQA